MSERILVDRKEFEAFLSENQSLLEKSQLLIQKIDTLENLNTKLEDELKTTKAKLSSIEARLDVDTREGDEALRKARETIHRLMRETNKRFSR